MKNAVGFPQMADESLGVVALDDDQLKEVSGGLHWILVGLVWILVGEIVVGAIDGLVMPCHPHN